MSSSKTEFIKYLKDSISLELQDRIVDNEATYDLEAPFYPTDETLCKLAKLVYEAEHKKIEDKLATDEWAGWTLLATGSFNQYLDNYFGAAFWHSKNRQLVISHKGTSSFLKDGKADVQGVILNKYTNQIHLACTFAFKLLEKLGNFKYSVSITGHSLGAWLSQVTAFAIEYLKLEKGTFCRRKKLERKYHPHVVVFDSPGCHKMLCILSKDYFHRYEDTAYDLTSGLDMTTYLGQPNLVNCKNQHVGKLLVFDFVIGSFNSRFIKEWFTLKHTVKHHGINNFLEAFRNKDREIFRVSDWPVFSVWKTLTSTVSSRDEYGKYYRFLAKSGNMNSDLQKENEKQVEIHFKLEDNDTTISSNIFTQEELIFLQNYKNLKENETKPSTISQFFSREKFGEFSGFLPDFTISENSVSCSNSKDLENVVNRMKRLFINFPNVKDVMKKQMLEFPKIFEAIYKARKHAYINTLPVYKIGSQYEIDFKDTEFLGLAEFLRNEGDHMMVLETENTKDAALRLHSILNKEIKINEDEFCLFGIKDLEYLEKCVDVKSVFNSKYKVDNLLIIDFGNEDDFTILDNFQENIQKKKIICITQKEIPAFRVKKLKEPTLIDLSEDSLNNLFDQNIISLNGIKFSLNSFLKRDNHLALSKFPLSALKDYFSKGAIEFKFEDYMYNKVYFNLSTIKVLKDVKIDNLTYNIRNYESTLKPVIGKSINDVIFLISVDTNQVFHELAEIYRDQIVLIDSPTDQDKIEEKFNELRLNHPKKTIFTLHLNSQTNTLTWIDVFNPDLYINRKFQTSEGYKLTEQELIKMKEKIIWISNSPGMGKSTTLLNAAKNISNSWIIWIDLMEAAKYIDESTEVDLSAVIKFLLRTGHNSSELIEFLLKYSLTNEDSIPIYLFFDAFDEIQDAEKIINGVKKKLKKDTIRLKILSILNFLNERTRAKIFISTRTYLYEEIKNWPSVKKLGGIKVELKEIDKEKQINFCKKFWASKMTLVDSRKEMLSEDINKYAEELLRNLHYHFDSKILSFLGIPLQLRMIVQVFPPGEIEKIRHISFNLYQLYSKFIDQKYEIFFDEKMCFTPDNVRERLKSSYQQDHKELAMKHLFPDLRQTFTVANKRVKDLNRIGLVQITDTTINFVHRTFAECFSAELFVFYMENKPDESIKEILVDKVFSQMDYAIIQRFISDILAITKKSSKILKFYPKIWTKITNGSVMDEHWYNFLHSMIESNSTKLMEFILENFKYAAGSKNDFINSQLHGKKLLYEAIKYEASDIAHLFLEYGAKSRFEDGKWVLHNLARGKNFNSLILKILKKGFDYKKKNHKDEMFLDSIFRYNNWDLLFDAFEFYENDRSVLNKHGTELFYNAVEKGRTDVATNLMGKEINFSDESYKWRYSRWNLINLVVKITDHEVTRELLDDVWNHILKSDIDIRTPNKEKRTLLHFAVAQNEIDIAKELVKKGADVNARDKDEMTPIFLAAENNRWDFIVTSFDNHFEILGPHKKTLLHLACKQRPSKEIFNGIADRCTASINSVHSSGKTPLFTAAEYGHWDLVSELMERNADLKMTNCDEKTILHLACEQNQKDMAFYLATNDQGDITDNRCGSTPLLLAAEKGHWDLVEMLIKDIGDPKWVELNKPNQMNKSLLRFACRDNKSELALHFIKKGANVKFSDEAGDTAEFLAAEKGHWDFVGKLIKLDGFNKGVLNKEGQTLLHLVCKSNQLTLALELIAMGADINKVDNNKNTPILLAAKNSHWELVKELMKLKKFDYTQSNKDKETLLHFACRDNEVILALKLITKGLNMNSPAENGDIPILLAAERQHWDLVSSFMKLEGFEVNISNRLNYTLLHFACARNKIDLVDKLIERGADINCTNSLGGNSISITARCGNWDLANILINEYFDKIDLSKKREISWFFYNVCENNKIDFVSHIVEKQIEVNDPRDTDPSIIPIFIAARKGYWEIVKKFLQLNTLDVNVTNEKREKLLHLACRNNQKELALQLTRRGAKIMDYNQNMDNSLLCAAKSGNTELVMELFQIIDNTHGFPNDIFSEHYGYFTNNYNKTMLHFACEHNNKDLALWTIEKGAHIYFPDIEKNTAILIAAGNGHWQLVEILRQKYASIYSINIFNETLLHLACRDNQIKIAENLIESHCKKKVGKIPKKKCGANFPNGKELSKRQFGILHTLRIIPNTM